MNRNLSFHLSINSDSQEYAMSLDFNLKPIKGLSSLPVNNAKDRKILDLPGHRPLSYSAKELGLSDVYIHLIR